MLTRLTPRSEGGFEPSNERLTLLGRKLSTGMEDNVIPLRHRPFSHAFGGLPSFFLGAIPLRVVLLSQLKRCRRFDAGRPMRHQMFWRSQHKWSVSFKVRTWGTESNRRSNTYSTNKL
jgi:hypothetical protein